MIGRNHTPFSLVRQWAQLGISRSGLYYRPKPENEAKIALMRLIDGFYTAHPFMGSRQITRELRRQGHPVNRKRVSTAVSSRCLMQEGVLSRLRR
jgi:putative transposase